MPHVTTMIPRMNLRNTFNKFPKSNNKLLCGDDEYIGEPEGEGIQKPFILQVYNFNESRANETY